MAAVTYETVGVAPGGEELELYTLTHPEGTRLGILNWGASILSLEVPSKQGQLTDVVLGLKSSADYVENNRFYIGTAIGRTAGRIHPAEVVIDGQPYLLTQNEATKHLHGGVQGLHNRCWSVVVPDPARPSIRLKTQLPDGLEGYPGTVSVTLICEWSEPNVLRLEYRAQTDRPTLFNPTRHDYFNLGGHDAGPIGQHVLWLPQSYYLPVDDAFVENLPPQEAAQTLIDFRTAKPLGDPLTVMEPRLRGINYAFLNEHTALDQCAAEAWHPETGIGLQFYTNQKTLQFYTGNFLDSSILAKQGATYDQHHGFCLEAMNFANGVHHPEWATACILHPEEEFVHTGIYKFSH